MVLPLSKTWIIDFYFWAFYAISAAKVIITDNPVWTSSVLAWETLDSRQQCLFMIKISTCFDKNPYFYLFPTRPYCQCWPLLPPFRPISTSPRVISMLVSLWIHLFCSGVRIGQSFPLHTFLIPPTILKFVILSVPQEVHVPINYIQIILRASVIIAPIKYLSTGTLIFRKARQFLLLLRNHKCNSRNAFGFLTTV